MTEIVIETPNSRLTIETFGDQNLIKAAVEEIKDTLVHYPPIVFYGKTALQRRDIGFYSDETEGYRYSGQIAKSQPLTSKLKELMEQINSQFGAKFNGILVNRYNGGKDYIGPHSDDEKYLDRTAGVVAISYGETRTFRIRGKTDTSFCQDIPLTNMSLVHMSGDFQKEFTHAIPIGYGEGIRYSFTFRRHDS